MDITEIVQEIVKQDCVEAVLLILSEAVIHRKEKAEKELADARASLMTINKINKVFVKNETIDALSEV